MNTRRTGAAVRLGLRLTGAGAGPARVRSLAVGLASSIGTVVLLSLAAVARAEQRSGFASSGSGMGWLLLAVVLSVALPVLVLAATAGRLSAELRDRRLANLRLLGLSPSQTRVVAVTETGVVALVGALVGLAVSFAVRPLLGGIRLHGSEFRDASPAPTVVDHVVVLVAVVVTVAALAALPPRLDMASALARAHRAQSRRPALWRFAPLLIGLALCTVVVADHSSTAPAPSVIVCFFAGVTLTGLGTILVTPVLVHLLAVLLIRADRPSLTIAGRRLQAQPAGVTRIVSALLIGLFLVTGARSVVVAFESTPQYRSADRDLHVEQRVVVNETEAHADDVARRAGQLDGVRRAVAFPRVVGGSGCNEGDGPCIDAVVATCARLRQAAPGLRGCVDGRVMWIADPYVDHEQTPGDLSWFASTPSIDFRHPVASFPGPATTMEGDAWRQLDPLQAAAVVPPGLLPHLPPRTQTDVLVVGPPGRGLGDRLMSLSTGSGYATGGDVANYDFVAGLRALVWGVATVILSVGLLAFGIAAVDRAVSRRREVVTLQLVGVSPGLLRRTQWIEAALPLCVGTVLAIGLGLVCGATYLSLGDEALSLPVTQSLTLAAVAALAAAAIAGLTVVAASPRLRPDLIRSA